MEGKDITLGQIVYSKAGRDRNRYFVVVGIPWDEYVLVVDGDLRKVENPKRKKIKHLIIQDLIALDIKQKLEDNVKINDSDIINSLESVVLVNESNSKEV
jgi:ribosomal protein L14E/L6E/L27E